jgi:hypothetical protein
LKQRDCISRQDGGLMRWAAARGALAGVPMQSDRFDDDPIARLNFVVDFESDPGASRAGARPARREISSTQARRTAQRRHYGGGP